MTPPDRPLPAEPPAHPHSGDREAGPPPLPGDRPGPPGSLPLGPLLLALRTVRGWSQLDVAERLCAASGVATITRNEVSRWERQRRVPGDFWLRWLATVFELPAGDLTAAARAGQRTGVGVKAAGSGPGANATDPDLLRRELFALAHRWLADPTGRLGDLGPDPVAATVADPGDPESAAAELAELRRLDDLIGGVDLRRIGGDRLRRVSCLPAAPTRRWLRLVAETAQLAGWLSADAGDTAGALGAYRQALTAAAGAGDRPLGAYVLGCASHLLAGSDPAGALLLARTGYAGIRHGGPAGVRTLLLHRVAFAAARDGQQRLARSALAAAARVAAARDPARDPGWLYWLDDAELSAMTGRCLAAAGRPLRAAPLLTAAVRRSGPARGAAIYRAWLARVYVDLGELEQACELADGAARRGTRRLRAGHRRAVRRPGAAVSVRGRAPGPAPSGRRLGAADLPSLP